MRFAYPLETYRDDPLRQAGEGGLQVGRQSQHFGLDRLVQDLDGPSYYAI
jgi:hypothetical protein